MENLYKNIIDFKRGNADAVVEIIKMFDPLLNKLARQSSCCDIKSELTLFMIELISKFPTGNKNLYYDKYIISYISKSIKHKYIHLNKKVCKQVLNESELDLNILENKKVENNLDMFLFKELIKPLTQKEQEVLTYKYAFNYSDIEISDLFNISRQSVNKTKTRALNKLKLKLDSMNTRLH
ncbi:MAG: sigma-70 family RNA polymerase sigma factor [Clostridium sp.]